MFLITVTKKIYWRYTSHDYIIAQLIESLEHVPTNIPVHVGGTLGAGQGSSTLAALQTIAVVPLNLKPSLQLKMATLPC